MRNFWLLARHEYRKLVSKRSFLVGTLGFPLIIMMVMAAGIFIAIRGDQNTPIGYVDNAGLINTAVVPQTDEDETLLPLRPFPNETAARQALTDQEIQVYFVIPADYRRTLQLDAYYWQDDPSSTVVSDFNAYLRANLASDYPASIRTRLVEGPDLVVRSADGSREFNSRNIFSFFIPFIAAFFFIFVVMSSSGYLLQVVTDEKENRTVEIMITTVSPGQLIGGKALGLLAVSLTQVVIWVLAGVVAVFIGSFFIEALRFISVPWSLLLVVIFFFVPAYAFIAGIMTAIGSAVTELTQAQQIAGILNLLFLLPFFFTALFLANPNSPILVFLTLFPTTSFITVMMRWGMSTVPLWQLALSWLILVGSAMLSVWVAARVFRTGMLRYGQSLSLKEALTAVRSRS
ncbi:MAG: ABC transporter permease [Ardenticatenaceae bacterium]|nr:ABC transporter permease [Ardenticatenaceae bacterium]